MALKPALLLVALLHYHNAGSLENGAVCTRLTSQPGVGRMVIWQAGAKRIRPYCKHVQRE